MIVITVARKPVTEESTLANLAVFGTGAINLRDTRETHNSASTGRFPSNFLLQHDSQCTLRGLKWVKGSNNHLTQADIRDIGLVTWKGLKRSRVCVAGHANEEGLEQVQDWQCFQGCPVHYLLGSTHGSPEVNPPDRYFRQLSGEGEPV